MKELGVLLLTLLTLTACDDKAEKERKEKAAEIQIYAELCQSKLINEAKAHPEKADASKASQDMDACMASHGIRK